MSGRWAAHADAMLRKRWWTVECNDGDGWTVAEFAPRTDLADAIAAMREGMAGDDSCAWRVVDANGRLVVEIQPGRAS